jgi:hypothetical protein
VTVEQGVISMVLDEVNNKKNLRQKGGGFIILIKSDLQIITCCPSRCLQIGYIGLGF